MLSYALNFYRVDIFYLIPYKIFIFNVLFKNDRSWNVLTKITAEGITSININRVKYSVGIRGKLRMAPMKVTATKITKASFSRCFQT